MYMWNYIVDWHQESPVAVTASPSQPTVQPVVKPVAQHVTQPAMVQQQPAQPVMPQQPVQVMQTSVQQPAFLQSKLLFSAV